MARYRPTHARSAGRAELAERSGPAAVSRRGLLTGAGAAVLAGSLIGVPEAQAVPRPRSDVAARTARPAHPDGAPTPTTIASAPISGYVYRMAGMYDFFPFNPSSQRTWGGSGVYTAGTVGPLRASFDLPPGAIVKDVEWYVYNGSSALVDAELLQFAAGSGTVNSLGAGVSIAQNSQITAVRGTVPADTGGPFPSGSRLLASINTSSDGTVQVNGVRVGYTLGLGTIAMLAAPVRAYDSRTTGGKFHAGTTRTVTLSRSVVPVGATGVLVNVTALSGTASGYLKIYPADSGAPSISTMSYKTDLVAKVTTIGVSAAGEVKIFASEPVDVVFDVIGYIC